MTATNKTTWPEHTNTWQDWSLGFRSGVNFPVALCFIEWMYLPGQSVGFVVPFVVPTQTFVCVTLHSVTLKTVNFQHTG